MHRSLILCAAAAAAVLVPRSPAQGEFAPRNAGSEVLAASTAPPARALLLELTSSPRLAGTAGSWRGARFVGRALEAAGWRVEYDERVVLLSMLARLRLAVHADSTSKAPILERSERFDPDAVPCGDVPAYSAWSASGRVRGKVVDAGRGLRADFERLKSLGLDLRGTIALVRYGGAYRGVKVDLATEYGCAGVLLFNDPAEDGGARGATWPDGPWKPDTSAQRGSISPMGRAPGDPSTPNSPSPRPAKPGESAEAAERVGAAEIAAGLPRIPVTPIGAREALFLRDRLAEVNEGEAEPKRLGPGPVEVDLDVEAPRVLRTIVNVIGTLAGRDERLVVVGNHRDAWVRGANDAGSGTVALLRAAQHLGERARGGWKSEHTLMLGFWDAEEFGLIGSTEWGEANAARLSRDGLCYVNADTAVAGTRFGASGSPGMLGALIEVLERIPAAEGGGSLADQWRQSSGEGGPRLSLPGSGSDFAVFAHHLAIPVLDFGFGGNSGGQYHTEFDDFAMVERYLDPGFVGHELAGRFVAELMAELGSRPSGGFDDAEAASSMAELVRAAGAEGGERPWLGPARAERLASALADFGRRERAPSVPNLYATLAEPNGIPDRPWYRNPLWAPGLETGYGAETLPTLRHAAREGEAALERELGALIDRLAPKEAGAVREGEANSGASRERER